MKRLRLFRIQQVSSLTPERGRLILTVTDWKILEDGSLTFTEPEANEGSASSWIIFTPSAFTLEAERSQLVRITIRAPATAKPVDRTGLFIEERPRPLCREANASFTRGAVSRSSST